MKLKVSCMCMCVVVVIMMMIILTKHCTHILTATHETIEAICFSVSCAIFALASVLYEPGECVCVYVCVCVCVCVCSVCYNNNTYIMLHK